LVRPRLFAPYSKIWLAELRRSPYRWRTTFETRLVLNASSQTAREAMYGETPLFSAVQLFRRSGLASGGRLVDAVAGRGRPLLAARWLGAEARGIELFPHHVTPVATSLAQAGARLEVGDAQTARFDDASHVFLNWTGLTAQTRTRVTERLLEARPGTRFIAVSCPVESDRVRPISRHRVLFTWGLARVYVQELQPASA
jgi:hypothetical protein